MAHMPSYSSSIGNFDSFKNVIKLQVKPLREYSHFCVKWLFFFICVLDHVIRSHSAMMSAKYKFSRNLFCVWFSFFFSAITTLSGYVREHNAHFTGAASPKYHAQDTKSRHWINLPYFCQANISLFVEVLPFLINFYPSIPANNSWHPRFSHHLSRHYQTKL